MKFRIVESYGIFKIGKHTKDDDEFVCYEAFYEKNGKIIFSRNIDKEVVKDWLDTEMHLADDASC